VIAGVSCTTPPQGKRSVKNNKKINISKSDNAMANNRFNFPTFIETMFHHHPMCDDYFKKSTTRRFSKFAVIKRTMGFEDSSSVPHVLPCSSCAGMHGLRKM